MCHTARRAPWNAQNLRCSMCARIFCMTDIHRKPRKPGSGRKAIYDAPMGRVNLPMTAVQRVKLMRLGGAAWVRQQIDVSPEPPRQEAAG